MPRSQNSSAIFRQALAATAIGTTLCWGAGALAALPVDGEINVAQAACSDVMSELVSQIAMQPMTITTQSSKSAAILNGQASALELILLAQQSGGQAPEVPETDLVTAEPVRVQPLAPAVGGPRLVSYYCPTPMPVPMPLLSNALGNEDFLASKRLAIGRTAFDRDWQRVSRDRISASRLKRLIGRASNDDLSALRAINTWVNQEIAFTEDRDLFSRTDFWAGAAATLRLRRGDCEDIALTKMQFLAAAGIPREDMILTIARDLVRNADHAVLIVRHEGRYYMLDNASNELFDASLSHNYRPILSFGDSQTWLHGY